MPMLAIALPPPWVLLAVVFAFSSHFQDVSEIAMLRPHGDRRQGLGLRALPQNDRLHLEGVGAG